MSDAPVVARYKRAIAKEDPKKRQLQPWELVFCEWYSNTPVRPKVQEQYDQAMELAPEGFNPGKTYIEKLKHSTAFIEYRRAIREDNLEAARKKLTGNFTSAVDAHFEGLAQAREAEDYKAIPAFTNPILDRVMPKNSASEQAAIAVQINISNTRQELMDEEPLNVEYEIIDDGTDTDDS